jgi:hypothetical protein
LDLGSGDKARRAIRDSRSPRQPRLWRRSRGRDRWRCYRQAEVVEDPADAVRVVDGGEQIATPPAVRAGEHVDEVDAAQQLGPGVALARAAVLRRGVGDGQLAVAMQRVVVERVVWRFGGAVGRTRRLRSVAFAVGAVVTIAGAFTAIVTLPASRPTPPELAPTCCAASRGSVRPRSPPCSPSPRP